MAQQRKGRGSHKSTSKRKPKVRQELVPHKIVGELWGKRLDEHGEIVGEEPMGPVSIFSVQFKKVDQLVNAAVDQARETERIAREAMSGQ
jgi:hypothetical protein